MAADHSWQTVLRPGQSDDYFAADHPAPFDPGADGFKPVNAWWLSELARLIYKRDATEGAITPFSRDDFLARVGLTERQFFNRPYVQACLVETVAADNAAFAALVFRGTIGRLFNWRFNLDMTPCAWPAGGRVHRGFKTILMGIWETIAAALKTVDKPLFFTGHSLGGALATMAASLHPPHAVYTFGAPRIGDAEFARNLAGVAVFNVFNPRDIVTHLPPAGPFNRFVHAGTMVKNVSVFPPHRMLTQAPSFLADHAPWNYTAQLPAAFDN